MLSFIKKNWFIAGLFAAVICGYNFSGFGKAINKDGMFFTFLVIFLFFIQGLTLQKEKIFLGIKNVKLHIVILSFIFIFYPLYFFAFVKMLPFINNEEIIVGLFVLACLPTTIASCAVFVSLAGGNVSGTIFNSVIANMAGVFISPLLFSFMLQTTMFALPLSMLINVFMSLMIKIILPMAVGMIVRNFVINIVEKNRKKFPTATNCATLCILFVVFAGSSDTITVDLVISLYPVFIFLALSYFAISFLLYKITNLLGFSYDDVIASVFTGAQKTLAMGAPLITLYFQYNPQILGIVLIPILFYHPWQLLSSSFIAKYFLWKKARMQESAG